MEETHQTHAINQQLPRKFEHQMYVGKICLNDSSGKFNQSVKQFIFGAEWKIRWQKENGNLGVYLVCEPHNPHSTDWKIEGTSKFVLRSSDGHSVEKTMSVVFDRKTKEVGDAALIGWEELEQHYLAYGFVNIKIITEIETIKNVEKRNIDYQDPNAREWDIILVVEGQKFHLLKKELECHSPYLEALFAGHFLESGKQEILLYGVYAPDFQKLWEFKLHHYVARLLDDSTVNGIMQLSDMYMMPQLRSYCVSHLTSRTDKSLKELLQLARLFHLKELQDRCIKEFDDRKYLLLNLQSCNNYCWSDVKELREQTCARFMEDTQDVELCALVESIVEQNANRSS